MQMPRVEYHSLRFKASDDFKLKRRANRDKLPIDANPDDFTLEQLMLNATMQKFSVSRIEVAGIMNVSVQLVNRYMLPPIHRNHVAMPPNFPMLLEAWCKTNRKAL